MNTNEEFQAALIQEIKRLEFLISRNGFDEAFRFADVTKRTYRRAVLFRRDHGLVDHKNRYRFIASYVVFKFFLKNKNLNMI